jgi:spore coat-associated protein N
MSRIKALWTASPSKVMAGLVGVLAATGIAVGSGANFNSASANPSNVFSAGTISQSNSKTGAAVLTAAGLKPGGTATGTVDIKNTGSVSGAFTLSQSNLTNTPTTPALSSKLTIVITDKHDPACAVSCPADSTVYSGTIGGMGTTSLGTFAAAETHRYLFTVTFPDGGASGADNSYQGAQTSVDYAFTATA